jgi:hypothetical protein
MEQTGSVYCDGLVKKLDGIDARSGTANDTGQETFDNCVSRGKPAYATLHGEHIKVTFVAYGHME